MKQWYVIQVLAGQEVKIKAEIARRIHEQSLQEQFGEVLAPEAKVARYFMATSLDAENENLFPGYMLVELEPSPQAFRLVKSTPSVVRFLGGEQPLPLEKNEVERVLGQMRGEVTVARSESVFEVGSEVEIKGGSFSGFSGTIESVDYEKERLSIVVSIFGRMTPIEVSFDQVV